MQPLHRGVPRGLVGGAPEAVGGVVADEVVHRVPVGRDLADQVGVGQLVQVGGGPVDRDVAQGGHRFGRQAGSAAGGAEPDEHLPGRLGQRGHRVVQGDPHRALRVVGDLERGAASFPQLLDEVPDRLVGPARHGRGRDPQRDRKVPTELREVREGLVLAGGVPLPDDPSDQCHRFGRAQHIEVDQTGPLARQQAGQRAPARDHHEAVRAGREQRADLAGRPGVVQQHQHPLVGQHGTEQGRRVVGVGRHLLRRDAHHAQQRRQPVERFERVTFVIAT